MTYRPREPWISEDDLVLTKTLGERVKYVRENLVNEHGKSLTQPALAALLGLAKGQHGVGGYETRGREPREVIRRKLAALTDDAYRPAVFSRAEAEVIVAESAIPRLRWLEKDMAWATGQIQRLAQLAALELDPLPRREDGQSELRSGDEAR